LIGKWFPNSNGGKANPLPREALAELKKNVTSTGQIQARQDITGGARSLKLFPLISLVAVHGLEGGRPI
jgi:hypothetical protein